MDVVILVFRYFLENDEKRLDKILTEKIEKGIPVYTNRVWYVCPNFFVGGIATLHLALTVRS